MNGSGNGGGSREPAALALELIHQAQAFLREASTEDQLELWTAATQGLCAVLLTELGADHYRQVALRLVALGVMTEEEFNKSGADAREMAKALRLEWPEVERAEQHRRSRRVAGLSLLVMELARKQVGQITDWLYG